MIKNKNELDEIWSDAYDKLLLKNAFKHRGMLYVAQEYIKYAAGEMDIPISYVQNRFDATKYQETGFFLVLDGVNTIDSTTYFFTDENGKLVIPCTGLQGIGDYWDAPVGLVVKALEENLTSYIAKHPEDAKKIPTKAFQAFPCLGEEILAKYRDVMKGINQAMSPEIDRQELLSAVRREVTYLNKVFNQKEQQLKNEQLTQTDSEKSNVDKLLPEQLFNRDRTL